MSPDVVVRVAEVSDAAELARLNAAFNGVFEPPETVAQRLADPARVETALIATRGARAVGFAAVRVVPTLFYAPPYAELTELYVEPDDRRHGIARRLVALAEERAKADGAEALVVLTGQDNAAAQALYRLLGYTHHDLALAKELID